MALDALEKDRLRRKMAQRMGVFLEGGQSVSAISSHVYDEPHDCELCQNNHAVELLVIKNRSSKKMLVAVSCLKEMIRFKITEVEDLNRWLDKITSLRVESEKRKMERLHLREEERKRLEKKVIVRKRTATDLKPSP